MDIVHAWLLILAVAFALATYRYIQLWRMAQDGYVAASTRAKFLERENNRLREREQQARKDASNYASQVSSLAQQLATLRVQHGAEPDERTFEPVEAAEPYSEELEEFLDGIESIEAVEVLEEEIEAMRAAGKSDTEILSRIRLGD